MNWQEFKCRCSAIKKMLASKQGSQPISEAGLKRIAELEARTKPMTEIMKLEYAELINKRDNPPPLQLGDTCIDYLMEVYAWETQGMIAVSKESLEIMATQKGKKVEGDSITLLCRHDKVLYKEHKDRIENDYLCGHLDIYLGDHVMAAENVTDIKSSFDYPSFLKKINTGIDNGYREQVSGYCDITGAPEGWIAYCLVDNPEEDILEMQYRISKKMGALTTESPEFLEEWKKWERSMRFSHIPTNQRVKKFPVELFSESERQKVYDRVKYCRDWLSKFDEEYKKL